MRPNLLEKSPTIHTIIVLVQYPCQIEGSTHSCNFILVETCTYLISTSYGGFITLHVRMSLPRSHRTGYHRLFSSMGQGGMLVSPYVSKTSLDPCCPNPLNMCIWIIIPGHPNPLSPCNHMWHMFYLERTCDCMSSLACDTGFFQVLLTRIVGNGEVTTSPQPSPPTGLPLYFSRCALATDYGMGRGLQSPCTHQMPGHFASRRFLKTSPLCHNRWPVMNL